MFGGLTFLGFCAGRPYCGEGLFYLVVTGQRPTIVEENPVGENVSFCTLKCWNMSKVYLFLAEGFEDIEALAVVDILRRGNVAVQTVSIMDSLEVKSAHGVTVKADRLLREVDGNDADALICPGGLPGAEHLGNCEALIGLLQRQYDRGGLVAAICAAPALVLSRLAMKGKHRVTCYPGFEAHLPGCDVSAEGVVVDGNLITGKGPGLAIPFGLKVLEKLVSTEVAHEVAGGMLIG